MTVYRTLHRTSQTAIRIDDEMGPFLRKVHLTGDRMLTRFNRLDFQFAVGAQPIHQALKKSGANMLHAKNWRREIRREFSKEPVQRLRSSDGSADRNQ